MTEQPEEIVLANYVDGRITAEQAADALGPGTAVVDVILAARARFGRLPDPKGPFEDGEYRRALVLLGLNPPHEPSSAADA